MAFLKVLGVVLGLGLVLLVAAVAAVIVHDGLWREPVAVAYRPPANMEIVKGSGPLGCDFSGVDSPILTGTLRQKDRPDKDIQLPAAYLPGPFHPKAGQLGNNGTLLMLMQIKDFMPYRHEEKQGKIGKPENDWIMLLITQIKPLDWIAQSIAEFNSGRPEGTRFRELPQPNGLLKLDYEPLLRRQEAFIAREGHQITDVIDCTVNNDPALKLSPRCNDATSASGLDIEFDYPVRELDNWKAIRERARKFIACIIVDSNSLEDKEK